ncbi:two component, sigma54 specific, transcriptional regulator, Fis family [Anaeromyxobacter dehalogenans 2CP-1]|uniref:DNA-binding transcriptional regulator NtrC n=1 Tax=Anaeromyxobacter dehalogenans (strain ATCC BAA-258 / DSM 21875 / 2CP-1) TaxID=455488 RepID=B8JCK3_ANAD2|nr:sigma-54 dependent transcriptional regulator [Anaeromyxobacter dehalogenans]ACL67723.1 two component, sigma54 specific, transcriptional regulator, Fis family [Anaeromyxobacter dehalogenans 2CP-1]
MRKVLIVDDEPSVRFVLARTCERAGVPYEEAGSAEEARTKLRASGGGKDGVGLVLLDVRLPGDDGFKLLGEIGGRVDSPFIVVMTAEDTMRSAVEAMKRGAADYLGKPFDLERVERIVRDLSAAPPPGHADDPAAQAEERGEAGAEARRLREGGVALPETLIGRSAAMVEVYKEIGRVARTEMTVLLMGESGTGKELVARAIHANSTRARGPFVTVNMAAIPRDLIESELYGHEKGSFTGAVERRPGKFELASGGTLFLDEIGEMPIELQAKLLRVLQEREIDRVGGTRPLAVDVRIVAATNADLARSVEEGRFRRDLYYRLAVVPIRLPPLREREGDVILLARHFVAKFGEQLKGRPVQLGKDAEAVLLAHPWPGNVRELQNVLQRALLKLTGNRVGARDVATLVPAAAASERALTGLVEGLLDAEPPEGGRYQAAIAAIEVPLIAAALARTHGNQLRAAELLGMNRNTLRERMRALGMKPR